MKQIYSYLLIFGVIAGALRDKQAFAFNSQEILTSYLITQKNYLSQEVT